MDLFVPCPADDRIRGWNQTAAVRAALEAAAVTKSSRGPVHPVRVDVVLDLVATADQ